MVCQWVREGVDKFNQARVASNPLASPFVISIVHVVREPHSRLSTDTMEVRYHFHILVEFSSHANVRAPCFHAWTLAEHICTSARASFPSITDSILETLYPSPPAVSSIFKNYIYESSAQKVIDENNYWWPSTAPNPKTMSQSMYTSGRQPKLSPAEVAVWLKFQSASLVLKTNSVDELIASCGFLLQSRNEFSFLVLIFFQTT